MAFRSRCAIHYGTRAKGMKSSFQPGSSFDSFTRTVGSQLSSDSSLAGSLNFGLTGTNLCSQTVLFQSMDIGNLNGGNGSIQKTTSDIFISSTGSISTLLSDTISSTSVKSNTLMMPQMTGGTLNTGNIYNDRGRFTSLSVDDYNFPFTAKLSNLSSTNCITGNNVYLKSMTFDTVFSSMSGSLLLTKDITGSHMFMPSYIGETIEGSSAFITNTYLSNFSVEKLGAKSVSAPSAFFTTITGAHISVSDVTVPTITGTSAVFSEITGSTFYGNMSVASMYGTGAFITNGILSNGIITSGSLSTYDVFPTAPSRITVNDLASETINLGVNVLDFTGSIWSTSSAKMGGDLPDTAYMFHVSDDMKCIASYNAQYNSMWNGTHYITSDGGNTWYPCTGTSSGVGYNMNGGICVSRDGSYWIGTRTSSGSDGGIYKSTDGVTFNQVLSVPLRGSTFQCCEISNDNSAVLVCTDSSPSNYTVPFYISLGSGEVGTWKAVIPSTTYDHYWISDTAMSKDGKYMAALDRNGIFMSVDYGNTWTCNGNSLAGYNKQIAMSKDGSHMYVSASAVRTFQISRDFGQTWITKPPTGDGYSGVDCDETGRYVFLTVSGKNGFLFSDNYGLSFMLFKVTVSSGNADDVNTITDGSKVMIYDGRISKLCFKSLEDSDIYNGKLTVNGPVTIKSGTQSIPVASVDNIVSGNGSGVTVAGVKMNNSSILGQGLQKLMTSNTLATRAVSNWTTVNTPQDAQWAYACWSPELRLLCSIANFNKVIVSSDGKNWTTVGVPSSGWNDLCWSSEKELFVAVGSSGSMYSYDGNIWTTNTASTANAVCYAPEIGLFCAIGSKSFTSTDGMTWISGSGFGSSANDICWSGDLGIFCSSNGYISTNGRTWSGGAKSYTGVCWAPDLNLFCAVGNNLVATSSNGTTWTTTSLSGSWSGISWSPELQVLVCVSSSCIGYSFDGITWTTVSGSGSGGLCWSKELGIFIAPSKAITMSRYVRKF
jgi:hypothetical protein